jgi:anti-sigma factor RsiW
VASRELSCREIVELVTEYLEEALAPSERLAFERHLAECASCALYLEQMCETIRLTGELREESLSPELREALVEAFGAWARRT